METARISNTEWDERMGTEKRMQLIRMLEKMEQNPEFSKKIGIRNKSDFKPEKS